MVMAQMVFLVTLSIVYTQKAQIKDIALVAGTYLIFFFAIAPRSVTFPGPVILKLLLVSCVFILHISMLRFKNRYLIYYGLTKLMFLYL